MTNWVARKPKVKPTKKDSPREQIAKIRGIKDVDAFLNPTQEELHDPYLLKNIEEASNRIIKALSGNEKIIVSYDADADGLTSASMLIRHLRNYSDNVDYIYNERNHGHGIDEQTRLNFLSKEERETGNLSEEKKYRLKLNTENLMKIDDADLLILVDSSSNDTKACKSLIEEYGVDIIVLDHHATERDNPYVLMVNPQQEGDEYPNKFLSGAGVVFKTIQVMEDTLGKVDPWEYSDLVAIGMSADMMRVDVAENRYLIMNGLRNIKNTGVARILKGAKADFFRLNSDSIGFSIGPLLNGVARMDNIKLAIDILLEDDDKICKKLRLQMQKLNEQRKVLQKEIVARYVMKVETNQKVLMVFDDESSKGFNGIVAQQLTDIYKRPVMVGRIHNGKASGSFRSYNGFKMKSFLQGFEDIEAMGHEGAGGFTVEESRLEDLKVYIKRLMPELDQEEPTIEYDIEIDAKEVDDYIRVVEQFNHVTGSGFPKVIARVNGVVVDEAECIGKTRETVKINTLDDLVLIKFRVDENYASELELFDKIDAVGELRMNEFYNFKLRKKIITPQVMISEYKLN
jgi:single-stranded-DNA-specific exonuclease